MPDDMQFPAFFVGFAHRRFCELDVLRNELHRAEVVRMARRELGIFFHLAP